MLLYTLDLQKKTIYHITCIWQNYFCKCNKPFYFR